MSDNGLFGPGTVTWRVTREGVLLLGGGSALILQVAHPLIAAGIAEHSSYREDPWGRLIRTLDLLTRITFGPPEVADAAARRLQSIHGRVRGVTAEAGGRFPAGTPYDARDPDLLLWVHATAVRTSLTTYTRYVGALTIAEQRRFYDEQRLLAEKFGIPLERQPETFAGFNQYFERMLESDAIAPTQAMRDVVAALRRLDLPTLGRPVAEAINLATIGLLPGQLRDKLGLPWGPGREALLAASTTLIRRALPLLPRLIRDLPPARSAHRRAKVA